MIYSVENSEYPWYPSLSTYFSFIRVASVVKDSSLISVSLWCQALEDGKRAEEKCLDPHDPTKKVDVWCKFAAQTMSHAQNVDAKGEALKPEVMMLKRSIGEITRRMPKKKPSWICLQVVLGLGWLEGFHSGYILQCFSWCLLMILVPDFSITR